MPAAPSKSKEATEPIFTSPIEKFTFQWNISDLTKDELKLLFWHRLFGHAGLQRIRKLAKLKLGVGNPENLPKGDIKCPVCMIAKGTRSNKLLPSYRPVEKLGIIACNLIGPFEIPTFDDGKYILTIRDLSTSYSEIKILKNKGETAKLLMEQITKFETVTGKKVNCIRSNNGGEFKSNVLAEFIKSKGIQAEHSLLYHHYQNGAIERFNQTIQDMGRAALTDSCLPQSFWGFAFLWANYTLNRLPNKISGNITPFKAFHGYRPVLDDLRIFGAKAFVLTPPEKRKKLDDRARKARVVGYVDGGKGWMLWDQADNKIVYSAWVQFADDPLRLSTGERQISDNLDPKLLRKEELEGRIGDVLDPALCQRASALCFVMACELGDFTAEETVQSQETCQLATMSEPT
jgi:transposase InsO family protein